MEWVIRSTGLPAPDSRIDDISLVRATHNSQKSGSFELPATHIQHGMPPWNDLHCCVGYCRCHRKRSLARTFTGRRECEDGQPAIGLFMQWNLL